MGRPETPLVWPIQFCESNRVKSIEIGNTPTRTSRRPPGPGRHLCCRRLVLRARGPRGHLNSEPPDCRLSGSWLRPQVSPRRVRETAWPLKADQIASEYPLDELSSPRQLRKYFVSGERHVVEGPDPHIWPTPPQTGRHQLQLVIVHPHGGVVGGDRSEPLVDLDVSLPPLGVENRSGDRVVVQRAQGGVAEASSSWPQPRPG